jgi:hypothetical protein
MGPTGGGSWMDISFTQWTSRGLAAGQPYPQIAPGTPDPIEAGWYQITWRLDMQVNGWVLDDPVGPWSLRFEHRAMVGRADSTSVVEDTIFPGPVVHPTVPDRRFLAANFTTTVFWTPGSEVVGGQDIDPHIYFPYWPEHLSIAIAKLSGHVTHFRAALYDEIIPV